MDISGIRLNYGQKRVSAYVGTNDAVIKSKDGNELLPDISPLSYDIILDLLKNI